MKFEIYQGTVEDSSGLTQWYWRTRSSNGRITSDGAEGYASLSNARRAVHRYVDALGATDFEIVVIQ